MKNFTLNSRLMKGILALMTVAVVFTACTDKQDMQAAINAQMQAYKDSIRMAADTAGLAEFQQWKAYNEMANTQQYNQNMQYAAAAAPVATRAYAPARRTSSRSYSTRSRSTGYESGSMSSTSSNAAKKRGWSKAAKGAVIGGVGGAAVGAVINKKNRALGAVVGGVIGGGGGYVIGRQMDKRDGRY